MEQATPQSHRIGWYVSDKDWAFQRGKRNSVSKGMVALATRSSRDYTVLLEHKEPEA